MPAADLAWSVYVASLLLPDILLFGLNLDLGGVELLRVEGVEVKGRMMDRVRGRRGEKVVTRVVVVRVRRNMTR